MSGRPTPAPGIYPDMPFADYFAADAVSCSALTAERLRSFLDYDPMTGLFTWKEGLGSARPAGKLAGCVNSIGYRVIMVDRVLYYAHRLAWLYVYGAWPKDFIDHIDMARDNNKISNLREATKSQNMQNMRAPSSNTSGVKGVTKRGRKWLAQIKHNKRHYYLGLHDTPEQAHAAYAKAAARLHKEFARTS